MSANMDNLNEIKRLRAHVDELVSENEKLRIERKRLEVEREKNIAELVECKNQCAMLKKELDYFNMQDRKKENEQLKEIIIGLCIEKYCKELGL